MIDSTTIRLFSDILKGVGRNPKGDGKKKGGLKVHMLIQKRTLRLRKVCYQDEKNRYYEFLTNNFDIRLPRQRKHFQWWNPWFAFI